MNIKKGQVSAADIIPSRFAVTSGVKKLRDEIRVSMKNKFKTIYWFHLTCDHWNDKRNNRDFFTVTLQRDKLTEIERYRAMIVTDQDRDFIISIVISISFPN